MSKSWNKELAAFLLLVLVFSSMVEGFYLSLCVAEGNFTLVVFEFGGTVPDGSREIAVAFHSLTFLDSEASSLGDFVFGSPDVQDLLEEGWYDGQEGTAVGALQWAGGPGRRASLRLQVPEGTKGLLLELRAAEAGLQMNVSIDGQVSSVIKAAADWHLEYVPIDDTMPNPAPEDEPEWFEGRYWPRFPATDRVYVTHVSCAIEDMWGPPAMSDWRIDSSYDTMMALTLVGMQGVINRYTPEVFLDWADNLHLQNRGWERSKFWLTQIDKHLDVVHLGLNASDSVNFYYQRYSSYFKGAVVYDPSVPDTINLATMIAGLENRIILAPEQLGLPGIPEFDDITDLTVLAEEQGWDATIEGEYRLYDWVHENLWPRLEKRIIGVMSPGPPTSRTLPGETDVYYPLGLAARDYLVALKLPVLYLSPNEEPQANLFREFLEEAPTHIIVSGFFAASEAGIVDLASLFGDTVPVITNTNSPFGNPDLTVLSALRPEIDKYESNIDIDRMFSTLGNTHVITSWCSDGDSIMMLTDLGWRWEQLWAGFHDRSYSVSINPTVIDLAPVVWNYYTQEDSTRVRGLVCGYSGSGYITPYYMSDEHLDSYLERTAWYMNKTGLRTVWRWRPWVNDEIGYEHLITEFDVKYYEALKDVGYIGMLIGTGSDGRFGSGFLYNGAPAPSVPPAYFLDGSTDISNMVDDILSREPGDIFIDLANYEQLPSTVPVVQDEDAYGGTSANFFSSEEKWDPAVFGPGAILAPGKYKVTYSMKVTDNQPKFGEYLTIMAVESPEVAWTVLDERHLEPTDFDQSGEYQNFTLEFTLDHFAVSVELILIYHPPPSGDPATFPHVYADFIHCEREGETGLPKFSGVLTSGWWEPRATVLEEAFVEAGGVVLHPDEFMAVLNPEYMLEWATEILGEENMGLAQARQQLAAGDYFDSLITTRKSLLDLPILEYQLEIPEGNELYTASIRGNTWITPIEYRPEDYTIKFDTHGPLSGTASISIAIVNELQVGETAIFLDTSRYQAPSDSNDTHTTYYLEFNQGPHTVEVTLPLNKPPVAAFDYTPDEPTVLDAVQFYDSSFDPESASIQREWDFGDGSTSTGVKPVHRYDDKGTYTVTLTVTDDAGLADTVNETLKIRNIPPTADFSFSPSSPKVGETIRFSDHSTDPESDPTGHQWDFGDGTSSTLSNPEHTYSTPGVKMIKLSVVDDEGVQGVATKSVTVEALRPAEYEVTDLLIEPGSVYIGGEVSVTVVCTNTGDESGNHTVTLKIDGTEIDEKTVFLEPGKSKTASFYVEGEVTGTHMVEVEGQSESFTVKRRGIPGFPYDSIVLGLIVGVLVLWLIQRRP